MSEEQTKQTEQNELDPKVQEVINRMAVLVGYAHAHELTGSLQFKIDLKEGQVQADGYEESIRPRLING